MASMSAHVTLKGNHAKFMVIKGVDKCYLKIHTGGSSVEYVMSEGHLDALGAAINDVEGEDVVVGEWFGNSE